MPDTAPDLPPRNYLAEAQAIAAGQSLMMAETAHLKAVIAHGQAIAQNLGALSRVLAALVVDLGHAHLTVPPTLLDSVERQDLSVVLRALPGGGMELLIVPAGPPQARPTPAIN
ncbi:MAG: hypothetical protein AB7G23_02905 [Vicinamibacterales bacterium]